MFTFAKDQIEESYTNGANDANVELLVQPDLDSRVLLQKTEKEVDGRKKNTAVAATTSAGHVGNRGLFLVWWLVCCLGGKLSAMWTLRQVAIKSWMVFVVGRLGLASVVPRRVLSTAGRDFNEFPPSRIACLSLACGAHVFTSTGELLKWLVRSHSEVPQLRVIKSWQASNSVSSGSQATDPPTICSSMSPSHLSHFMAVHMLSLTRLPAAVYSTRGRCQAA